MNGQHNRPKVLEVKDLAVQFDTLSGTVHAVNGLSFDLHRGETVGLVGESGCGKSVTSLSILGLLPKPPARIASGEVLFEDRDLLRLPLRELRKIRGNRISMVFQEPMTALTPVLTIEKQLCEVITLHRRLKHKAAVEVAMESLRRVHVPDPAKRLRQYPHELSGGLRQRIMISMALLCNPTVLIADEPTTALDVTIQLQILALLRELRQELDSGILLITHDLGVVAETADRVIIMYVGNKVEESGVDDLFTHPLHPYTRGLLNSLPGPKPGSDSTRTRRLEEIQGTVPSLLEPPHGCSFHGRCPLGDAHCESNIPQFEEKRPGHFVACWKAQ